MTSNVCRGVSPGAMPNGSAWACLRICGRMWSPHSLQPTIRESCLVMDERRKACRRFNEVGHAHALTFSCFCRRPFLSKDRSRMWLIEAIDQARQIHAFDLWAYVVMPEHAHLLIWPRKPMYSISRILTSIKRPVSRKALSYVRTSAPNFLSQMEDRQPGGRVHDRFWQRGGGYDRNLTEPKSIWAEIDYFHANPVRRGLCDGPTAWLWSSARELEQPGSGLLRLDLSSVPRTLQG
jgi:putative transposase